MRAMKDVPTSRPIIFHMPDGSSFPVRLHPFPGEGEDTWGWVSLEEGAAPADWTDDVCWSVNEDGRKSTLPVGWSEINTKEGGK